MYALKILYVYAVLPLNKALSSEIVSLILSVDNLICLLLGLYYTYEYFF